MTSTQTNQSLDPTLEAVLIPLVETAKRQRSSGDLALARTTLYRAISLCKEFGDSVREGTVLQVLAAVELDNSNFEAAFQMYTQAMELHLAANRKDLAIPSISGIGYIYQVQGQYDLALANAEEALTVSRECGIRRSEAAMLGNLGILHIELKQLTLAEKYLVQALEIHRAEGFRDLEAQCLIDYAKVLTFTGKLTEAANAADSAVTLARELKMRNAEALALSSKGLAMLQANRWEESAQCSERALEIFREIGNRRFVIITLSNLGLALQNADRPHDSETAYREVIELCRANDDHHSAGYAMMNLGVLLLSQDKNEEAERLLIEAVEIYRGAHNDAIMSVGLFDLALNYLSRVDWVQANDCVEQALALDNEWVSVSQNPLLFAIASACKAALGDWKTSDLLLEKLYREGSHDNNEDSSAIPVAEGFRALFKGDDTVFEKVLQSIAVQIEQDKVSPFSELGLLYRLLQRSKNTYWIKSN